MLFLPEGRVSKSTAVSEIGEHWVEVFYFKSWMVSCQYSICRTAAGKSCCIGDGKTWVRSDKKMCVVGRKRKRLLGGRERGEWWLVMLVSALLIDGLLTVEDCHVVWCDAVWRGINSACVQEEHTEGWRSPKRRHIFSRLLGVACEKTAFVLAATVKTCLLCLSVKFYEIIIKFQLKQHIVSIMLYSDMFRLERAIIRLSLIIFNPLALELDI